MFGGTNVNLGLLLLLQLTLVCPEGERREQMPTKWLDPWWSTPKRSQRDHEKRQEVWSESHFCDSYWTKKYESSPPAMDLRQYQELTREYENVCDLYVLYDYTFQKYAEGRGLTAEEIVREAVELANKEILEQNDLNNDGLPLPDYTFGLKIRKQKYLDEDNSIKREGNVSSNFTDDLERTREIQRWIREQLDDVGEWRGCAAILFHRHTTRLVNDNPNFDMFRPWSVIHGAMACTCDPRHNAVDLALRVNDIDLGGMSLAIHLVHTIFQYGAMKLHVPLKHVVNDVNDKYLHDCRDFGDPERGGNYLLTFKNLVYDGSKENHKKIAPCWIKTVSLDFLRALSDHRTLCWLQKCGNGRIDDPQRETCDCRNRWRRPTLKHCLESDEPCCNDECQVIPRKVGAGCGRDTDEGCMKGRKCDGTSTKCPTSGFAGLYCGEETKVCTDDGNCTDSICRYWGTYPCECSERHECDVCCVDVTTNECVPSKDLPPPEPHHKLRFVQPEGTQCGKLKEGGCNDGGNCIYKYCGNGKMDVGLEECECTGNNADRCRSEQPCCDLDRCVFEDKGEICSSTSDNETSECFQDISCNGYEATCPGPKGKLCANGTKTCSEDGQCVNSICAIVYGDFSVECNCMDNANQCKVCCESPLGCVALEDMLSDDLQKVVKTRKPDGTPCGLPGKKKGRCQEDVGLCSFDVSRSPSCGDGRVDPDAQEDCDCGEPEDECERQQPCCDQKTCRFVAQMNKLMCRSSVNETQVCRMNVTCNGKNDACPESRVGETCAHNHVCNSKGECQEDRCIRRDGFHECQCLDVADLCSVCCESSNSSCHRIDVLLGDEDLQGISVWKVEGTECGHTGMRQGTCDGQSSHCTFSSSKSTTCGDGILDETLAEECDCEFDEKTCARITPCCNYATCKFVDMGVKCWSSETNECLRSFVCNGSSAECPPPRESLPCNGGTGTCSQNGSCVESLCMRFGMEECVCWHTMYACKVCCQKVNDPSTCRPLEHAVVRGQLQGVNIYRPRETPCGRPGRKNGTCDDDGRGIMCRFFSTQSTTCGDGFVDASLGEQCDCEFDESTCKETHPCCDHETCKLIDSGDRVECSRNDISECTAGLVCDGVHDTCPSPRGRLCDGGRRTCNDEGYCILSLCASLGDATPCTCQEAEYRCQVCCKVGGACVALESLLDEEVRSRSQLRLPAGNPCGREGMRKGTCDANGECHYSPSNSTTCGDGFWDSSIGEQCDCPLEEDVCLVREPCCDHRTCKFLVQGTLVKCWNYSEECANDLECNGRSKSCPSPRGRLCAMGTKACETDGSCTGSPCLHVLRDECVCPDPENQCRLCCKEASDRAACQPLEDLILPEDRKGLKWSRPAGSSCFDNVAKVPGMCDEVRGVCILRSDRDSQCGDGLVDGALGEQCDCPLNSKACQDSEPCCNHTTCKFVRAEEHLRCWKGESGNNAEEECWKHVVCNGRSSKCPPDTTDILCDDGRKTCSHEGKCDGSLCNQLRSYEMKDGRMQHIHPWKECQCVDEGRECGVCCQQTSDSSAICRPLKDIDPPQTAHVTNPYRTSGTLCTGKNSLGSHCSGMSEECPVSSLLELRQERSAGTFRVTSPSMVLISWLIVVVIRCK